MGFNLGFKGLIAIKMCHCTNELLALLWLLLFLLLSSSFSSLSLLLLLLFLYSLQLRYFVVSDFCLSMQVCTLNFRGEGPLEQFQLHKFSGHQDSGD